MTVYHRGFHGDLNETFLVGNVSDEDVRLVKVTHECLQEAINIGSTFPLALCLFGRRGRTVQPEPGSLV